jgi:hypothetical protein
MGPEVMVNLFKEGGELASKPTFWSSMLVAAQQVEDLSTSCLTMFDSYNTLFIN